MAEVPFRPVRQLSEYKGKGASASREWCSEIVVITLKKWTHLMTLMPTTMLKQNLMWTRWKRILCLLSYHIIELTNFSGFANKVACSTNVAIIFFFTGCCSLTVFFNA